VLDKAPKVPMYRPEQSEPRWLRVAEFWKLHRELPAHLKLRRSSPCSLACGCGRCCRDLGSGGPEGSPDLDCWGRDEGKGSTASR